MVTQTQLIRGLNIERERFREWLKYIKPEIEAPGQGIPAYYSDVNILCFAAFKKLVDFGFKRAAASRMINTILDDMQKVHKEV